MHVRDKTGFWDKSASLRLQNGQPAKGVDRNLAPPRTPDDRQEGSSSQRVISVEINPRANVAASQMLSSAPLGELSHEGGYFNPTTISKPKHGRRGDGKSCPKTRRSKEQAPDPNEIEKVVNSKGRRVRLGLPPSLEVEPLIQNGPLLNAGHVTRTQLEVQCEHCGLLVNKVSIARHENWCSRQSKSKSSMVRHQSISSQDANSQGEIVARVVTVGLVPGKYEQVLIRSKSQQQLQRPKTRTLPHSTLHSIGHGLPLTEEKLYTAECETHSLEQCKNCGKIIASDKVGIHHRLCQSNVSRVPSGTVMNIPSTHNLLRVGREVEPSTSHTKVAPSTVICYICGRDYGSKSIAIHEPQCLKKFNIQNDKLPIDERLPLPKKRSAVARVLLREEEMAVVVPALPRGLRIDKTVSEPKEKLMQRYFESCYSEFERDLMPCKKCGRKFAPERHAIHERNCNAKPLKLL